jgi:Rap1a immunity proteins
MRWLICLFAILNVSTAGAAGTVNGSELLHMLESDDPQQSFAVGFVLGTLEGWGSAEGNKHHPKTAVCVSSRITATQLAQIVKAYLSQWPETRDAPAAFVVIASVARAFPCQSAGPE